MSVGIANNSNVSSAAPTLLKVVVFCIIIGFAIGGIYLVKDIMEASHLQAQVSQIETFEAATANFFDKYDGLPGDLLSVSAVRAGFAAGNGMPGNSDGDGKLSPCSIGWQWNLGCETALFWSQLSGGEFIPENFSTDNNLADHRLDNTDFMTPYLPHSPINDNIYITVWNSDAEQISPSPRLPYGNYYEITRIEGVKEGRMVDNPDALTPLEARVVDEKIDDGAPLSGRVTVNGTTHWPEDAWGTLAKPGTDNCVSKEGSYNSYEYFHAHRPLCHLAIAFKCCARQKNDY